MFCNQKSLILPRNILQIFGKNKTFTVAFTTLFSFPPMTHMHYANIVQLKRENDFHSALRSLPHLIRIILYPWMSCRALVPFSLVLPFLGHRKYLGYWSAEASLSRGIFAHFYVMHDAVRE